MTEPRVDAPQPLRVDHIALACRDVEAQRAWYERVLGFEASVRKGPSRPGGQGACLVGPPGGPVRLELMPDDGRPATGREPFTRGIAHIALGVDDFAAWEARHPAEGAQVRAVLEALVDRELAQRTEQQVAARIKAARFVQVQTADTFNSVQRRVM